MEYLRLKDVDLRQSIGTRVFLTFMAKDVSVRVQKDKVTKFIVFNMADKGTTIEARIFGATDAQIEMIKEGSVYNSAVDIKPYDKAPSGYSCIIYNIDYSSLSPKLFADWADNMNESRNSIDEAIKKYYNTVYGKIGYPILIKHWERFVTWTAASGMHHTQLGGLLTHTAEVVETAEHMADYYNNRYGYSLINKPLLVWSAILHDIGKTSELDVDILSGKVEYSREACLQTHIMGILADVEQEIFCQKLGEQCYELGDTDEPVPQKSDEQIMDEQEACLLLKHCLAAHHGKLEYGSPITPSVPEAMLLNIMDELSAEVFRYNKAFKDTGIRETSTQWLGGNLVKYYRDDTKVLGDTNNFGG